MAKDIYTHGHTDSVLQSHAWRTAQNSAGHLLDHLHGGQRLLDVGCGIGTITRDLAALVAPGEVIGLDNSAEVIEQASGQGPALANCSFVVGDAYDLAYEDGHFDVVHAHQILHHLSEPAAAIREMARVAAPGGLISLREADYAAMTWYPELPGLAQWNATFQAVVRTNGAEPAAGRRLLAWAHAAGLRDLTASAGIWCFATPEDRAWWGETWAERCTGSGMAEQALVAGMASQDDLSQMAADWRAWAADDDAWFAVPHGQVLARVG